MESVKLMLEDKEVSCRMMACMLVDGDILGHAIWKKYGELAQNNRDHAKLNTKFDHTRIIRENIEKLFTVYFRLAELKERDVQSLVKKFGTTNSTVVAPATISPTQQKEPNKGHGVAPAQIESQSVNVTPAKLYIDDPESLRSAIKPHSIITLTDSERQAVEAALFLYLKEKPETLLVGPRSVRAFIFRYQLVRLIFEKRGIVDFDPSDVISKLAEKTFGAASTKPKSSDAISEVDAVLEMVT
jgi:hypothetical protein